MEPHIQENDRYFLVDNDYNTNIISHKKYIIILVVILTVRIMHNIGKGTGTLLSPTDRKLGDEYPDALVLTMYKITGNRDKGWDGSQIWIPNIKFPGDCAYYSGENI